MNSTAAAYASTQANHVGSLADRAVPSPQPTAPVVVALGELANAQGHTHDLIDLLVERLASVLRPSPPTSAGKALDDAQHASPLHGELVTRGQVQLGANVRLQDILARLSI